MYDLAIRPLLVKAATVAKEYPAIAKYSKPFLEEPTPAAADKTKKKVGRSNGVLGTAVCSSMGVECPYAQLQLKWHPDQPIEPSHPCTELLLVQADHARHD